MRPAAIRSVMTWANGERGGSRWRRPWLALLACAALALALVRAERSSAQSDDELAPGRIPEPRPEPAWGIVGVRVGFEHALQSVALSARTEEATSTTTVMIESSTNKRGAIAVDFSFRLFTYLALGPYLRVAPVADGAGLNLGGMLSAHLMPASPVNVWLGLGLGYQWLDIGSGISGFEAVPQLGVDITRAGTFAYGPYLELSFTRYRDSECAACKGSNTWLGGGVRFSWGAARAAKQAREQQSEPVPGREQQNESPRVSRSGPSPEEVRALRLAAAQRRLERARPPPPPVVDPWAEISPPPRAEESVRDAQAGASP